MSLPARHFLEDYFRARDRFRELAGEAGGKSEALVIDAKGPGGEDLTIDIAWLGAERPRRVVLHSSGVHGVEGFAGSAIQLQLLAHPPALPADAALVVVHALNPYGMAWLRRVNENNVDLNRNSLGDAPYAGAPPRYAPLDPVLNPASPPSSDFFALRAAWLVLRHGMSAMKQATVGGQYEYPKGLFFGGKELQEGLAIYQSFLSRRLASVERVTAIDVHTGLGKHGEDILLVDSKDHPRLRDVFGPRVAAFESDRGSAYPVQGGLPELLSRALAKAPVAFVCQEFGTYGPMRVLHALREENRWHHFGDGSPDHPVKHALREAFCPKDGSWRQAVLKRGADLLNQAMDQIFFTVRPGRIS